MLFVKGPLAEVHLPIDFLTKKAQGFAFVTFVFAEHAVKAFTELDGKSFQVHILLLLLLLILQPAVIIILLLL